MSTTPRTTRNGHLLPAIFILGDIIIVNLVFWLTITIFPSIKAAPQYLRELWLLVEVSAIPMAWLQWGRSHQNRAIRMELEMRMALIQVAVFAACFLSLLGFIRLAAITGRQYLTFFALLAAALTLFQIIGKYLVKQYRRQGYNYTRVVIVGTGSTARRLQRNMLKDAGFGYRILAFFDDDAAEGFDGPEPLPVDSLRQFVADNDVQQIFFTLSGHHPALNKVIKIADDNVAEFYYVPQIPSTLRRGFELHSVGSLPVMATRHNPLQSWVNRTIKRTFDIVVSGTFLCFYPLIYIPVAIAIKMSSPGPVYFRQDRTGYRGKTFSCLKFRTMRVNAGADRRQATADDPRKTRIGDLLRRTSVDELPQFINVFKGDMSIVGPRPHMLKHTEDYTRLIDAYMVRHAVKPGITGWAQVNGYRGITDELWKMERRVEHDVWYIENWNFFLDLKIMVRTVLNAVHGEKNAF